MVGQIYTLEEFELYADEIITPVIRALGGIPQAATSEFYYKNVQKFRKTYRLSTESELQLSYDNGDYYTMVSFRKQSRSDSKKVDILHWLVDNETIERPLYIRCYDQYLPMALRSHAELLQRFGARFLDAQTGEIDD